MFIVIGTMSQSVVESKTERILLAVLYCFTSLNGTRPL